MMNPVKKRMNNKVMITIPYLLVALLTLMCGKSKDNEQPPPVPPPVKRPLTLADPFVLKHEGMYYIYGTSGTSPDEGIPVYRSADMVNWEGPVGKAGNGNALMKGQSYGTAGFWAPNLVYSNNRFYMFYTANEHIAVASSDSPLGPFTQTDQKPLHESVKEIDPHVFVDDDGKKYLYFVRLINGNRTYGAELNDDWQSVKENTVQVCITQSQDWEIVSGAQWPVTEAPAMIKHRGLYYLFYTANDFRSPDYNVGYATASSPLGPWTKFTGNPLFKKTDSTQGTGSCEFLPAGAGKWFMFLHAHYSQQSVGPRRTMYSKCVFEPSTGNAPDLFKPGPINKLFIK